MRNFINLKFALRIMLVFALLLIPATQNAFSSGQNASLDQLKIDQDGASIRISLEGAVKTKTFTLDNPYRWVLDITPAKWSSDLKKSFFPDNDKYFSKVRIGQWQSQTARLVIHIRDTRPNLDVHSNYILIKFGNADRAADTPTDLLDQKEPENTGKAPGKSFLIPKTDPDDEKTSRDTGESRVVEIPRVLSVSNQKEEPQLSVIPVKTAATENSDPSDLLSDLGNPENTVTSDIHSMGHHTDQFEIMSDGSSTRISIPLISDNSYNVRRERFPDRLVVEYPSCDQSIGTRKIRYVSLGREKMPIGIIEYCGRFTSKEPAGYRKLVFYAKSKFKFSTSLERGTLNIEIREISGPSVILAQQPEEEIIQKGIPVNKEPPADLLPETPIEEPLFSKSAGSPEPIVEIPKIVKETPSDELIETKVQPVALIEETPEDTQTFSPPDRRSFLIDEPIVDEKSGHTIPESVSGIKIKEVEASETTLLSSAREMMKFLPDYANSSFGAGKDALGSNEGEGDNTMIAEGPVMIDPPEQPKLLPRGTRPAADLFLTRGESVILPVRTLIRASVGDPEVLVVNVLSQEELLLTAKGEGRTTLITWEDGIGRSVRWVNVSRSTLMKTIEVERVIANPNIKVSFIGESTIVLEGTVETEEEMKRAVQIAAGAVSGGKAGGGASEDAEGALVIPSNVVNLLEMSNPKQVLVKVRMAEIQTKDKEEFLKQFGTGTRTESGDFQFNVITDIIDPEFGTGGIFDIALHPSILRGDSGDQRFDPVDLLMSFIEQTRRGKVLSQPNLVTLSGHRARFRVGGEIPYTYQNENGFNVVDFREFGIELNVYPKVDSENNINLSVYPIVRIPDFTLAIAGIPGFKTREVQTDIQVGDGQTIVIGGLLQQEEVKTKSKVPVLGDVPLIGELFRSSSTTNEEIELLVFITPIVLKDVSMVEGHISNQDDVSLSPYYQREMVEGVKED